MDITGLTLSDLRKLQRRVDSEIKKREDTSKRDLLKQMQRMAAEAGMSLEEVVGNKPETPAKPPRKKRAGPGRPAKAKKITVPPKYRNPGDVTQTWTGRGRKPVWIQKCLDEGMSLEQLSIQP